MFLRSMLFIPLFLVTWGSRALAGVTDGTDACPPLMTERECADYASTLERLQPGADRDAFLLAHARLMDERKKTCSCTRHLETLARKSPSRTVETGRVSF